MVIVTVVASIHSAGIAQLVEHNLAKVGVASSSLVSRSKFSKSRELRGFFVFGGLNGYPTATKPPHECPPRRGDSMPPMSAVYDFQIGA